jgi:hypothetical protein
MVADVVVVDEGGRAEVGCVRLELELDSWRSRGYPAMRGNFFWGLKRLVFSLLSFSLFTYLGAYYWVPIFLLSFFL